jgi:hypothetical protein
LPLLQVVPLMQMHSSSPGVQSGGISVVEPVVVLVDTGPVSVSVPVVRPCVVVESSVVDTVVVVSVDVTVVLVPVVVVVVDVGAPEVGSVDGAVLDESVLLLVVGRLSVVATASPQAGTISVKQRKVGRNVIFMRRRYHFAARASAPDALNC